MTVRNVVLGFSLLAFAGAAYANEQKAQEQKSQSRPSQAQEQKPAKSVAQSGNTISAERLLDADVVDRQGRELGEIEEVVIDLNRNRVHAVVLSFGGFLGMGDKQFAFPMSELKSVRGEDRFMVDVSKERLENAQGFAKGQTPGMGDEFWTRVGQRQGEQAKGGKGRTMNLVQAGDLIGKEVQAKGGEQIGEIRDVLISRSDGQLRHLVIGLQDGGQASVQAKGLSSGTGDKLILGMSAAEVRAQATQTPAPRRGAVGGTAGAPPATQDRSPAGNR